tara:strand:+ start:279 stop:419 length:141 start_codon:yes stop_codon:yes gene_type:complete
LVIAGAHNWSQVDIPKKIVITGAQNWNHIVKMTGCYDKRISNRVII